MSLTDASAAQLAKEYRLETLLEATSVADLARTLEKLIRTVNHTSGSSQRDRWTNDSTQALQDHTEQAVQSLHVGYGPTPLSFSHTIQTIIIQQVLAARCYLKVLERKFQAAAILAEFMIERRFNNTSSEELSAWIAHCKTGGAAEPSEGYMTERITSITNSSRQWIETYGTAYSQSKTPAGD